MKKSFSFNIFFFHEYFLRKEHILNKRLWELFFKIDYLQKRIKKNDGELRKLYFIFKFLNENLFLKMIENKFFYN